MSLDFDGSSLKEANALLIYAAVVVDFCAKMSASECTKSNVERCVKWSNFLCVISFLNFSLFFSHSNNLCHSLLSFLSDDIPIIDQIFDKAN